MTIREAISQLTVAAEKIGENSEFVVMKSGSGENDYVSPDFTVVGELEDQDGSSFRCAMVGSSGGEELSRKGVPHYEWNSREDMISISV